jgi:hypothetical protein
MNVARPLSILRRHTRRVLIGGVGLLLCVPALGQVKDRSASHVARTRRFLRGRTYADGTNAAAALAAARAQSAAMSPAAMPSAAMPRTASLAAAWAPVGPAQIATAAHGDVTGRVTSIAIDPADATGNTVYIGTTGGGVWKSVNAAGSAASVSFTPLTDTLPVFSANAGTSAVPSLSIGALAIANGVLLAGTGDPNDASDSYYGGGLLRSVDGGSTWTLIQGSQDGLTGNHSFVGLSFAGFASSSSVPSLIVAAVSQAVEGSLVNAPNASASVMGLYSSNDAGQTWQMATVMDGSQTVQTPEPSGLNRGGNAATAVVWNPLRQRFYAALRYHGFYESTDGAHWTRVANQPGTALTLAACPTNPASTSCPLFRGALAVQPVTGDTFAFSVDANDNDQGLWQDVCASNGTQCATGDVVFATKLPSAAFEVGNGSAEIAQGDYDLALAAVANGSDTLVYTGTIDLYRCSLAAGCVQRNTTNAENGCAAPAQVAGAQHAIATLAGAGTSGTPLLYLGNDGGLWRSNDGVNQQLGPCSANDASHFQNLNGGLGSLAEIVSFAQDPVSTTTLLAGVGANGTAGTGNASTTGAVAWAQLATGEGGTVAIDAATPSLWYLSTASGVSIGRCMKGVACAASDFAGVAAIGAAQVAGDASEIDAPWLLDPANTAEVSIGTCRAWRGPANGAGWSNGELLSRPFGSTSGNACGASSPLVRSLAVGGAASATGAAPNLGSEVVYAGLAGSLDGGGTLGGHLFATVSAQTANGTTVWTDTALGTVTNDTADAGVFNPGGFDLSSVAVDPHDATGNIVYATVMGFAGNGVNAPHLYRTVDGGAHWLNLSSNLPNAPANGVAVDPNDANTVYVALDSGVYVTTQVTSCSTTNCWSVYGTGLPNAPVVSLEPAVAMATGDGRTGELRAATYGRGIWQIPLLTAVSPAAPAIALSPLTLTFSSQPVGSLSALQTVTVTNTGNVPVTVSSIVTNGDFTQSNSCVGQPLGVNASCAVQVGFLPSATGARTGLLTVYANVPGGQATVALSGTGLAPAAVVLNPVALNFGSIAIGSTSAAQNVTVSNTGGVPTALTTITVTGDFSVSLSTCGLTLAAGTGCTVSVVFKPAASGSRAGTFTLVDSVGTQTASLVGTGLAPPTDALSVSSLSFAPQQLNTASATQQVTLTNSGDTALTLVSAQIASGDFTVVDGCGASLNAHSSCAMAVAYVPKSVGPESGVLLVADTFRTQSVTLSGTGVAPPGVSLSPVGGLAFAATPLGSTAASQTMTLTNNGGLPLALSGVFATGDFALVTGANPCGATLAVGTSCAVNVAFTPTAGGTRTGSLTVTDNAAGSPQTLALSGVGIDFSLTSSGTSSVSVPSGSQAVFLLLLSSAANVPGTASLTCSGAPAHTSCSVSPASGVLGGTTVVTVSIATGVAELHAPTMPWDRPSGIWMVSLLPLGLLALRRRRIARLGCVLCVLAVLSGCGAARLIPATTVPLNLPAGTPTASGSYAITVSATSAGLTRSAGLTLVVP